MKKPNKRMDEKMMPQRFFIILLCTTFLLLLTGCTSNFNIAYDSSPQGYIQAIPHANIQMAVTAHLVEKYKLDETEVIRCRLHTVPRDDGSFLIDACIPGKRICMVMMFSSIEKPGEADSQLIREWIVPPSLQMALDPAKVVSEPLRKAYWK